MHRVVIISLKVSVSYLTLFHPLILSMIEEARIHKGNRKERSKTLKKMIDSNLSVNKGYDWTTDKTKPV